MNRKLTLSLAAAASLSVPLVAGGIAVASDAPSPKATGNAEIAASEHAQDEAPLAVTGLPAETADLYAAFWDAGYNYNQLLALAAEWNVEEFEAKARAGQLIVDNDTAGIDAIVAGITEDDSSTVPSPVSAFFDAGYTYDDAVELGTEWNIDPYDAKVQAGELIADGNADEVDALLAD